ncbi:BIG1-domain-containing protein [Hyphopichia burtonii NRRL Y-1933]|uniref:Protein BIG1 n=1 Tax=Hyphopichia burtonii NRRL Y-1933 TaxID=984485 RepID=A0A1E4RH29_9ASCO|nr:BIG1-domain-containing protein [Hyphopichia burtonii NRRL Y-1933]ODV66521.1 BIG1-domain-containing protein [Hyphopichia burtonii NRRL Y-1933]
MRIATLIPLLGVIPMIEAFKASPLVLASHKLVKGLRDELEHGNSQPHSETSVTNMLKKLMTECSSDAYLLVNQPGLKYEDMVGIHEQRWPFLQKYLTLASSVVGIPWVKGTVDLNFVENYLIKNCEAETITVLHEDEAEVGKYIDTRKRIIRVELSEIPEDIDEDERGLILKSHDELVRQILRKVPSPHYTIILTSSTTSSFHPIPPLVVESKPEKYEMFNEIINHPSRQKEVERNAHNYQNKAPEWNQDRNTVNRYLKNRKNDEVHLFRGEKSMELWKQNEKIVSTMLVMIVSIFLMKIMKLVKYIQHKLSAMLQKPNRKQGLLDKKSH